MRIPFRQLSGTRARAVWAASAAVVACAWYTLAQQPRPLEIANIQVDAITHSSARVGWVMSKKARSWVEYGRTADYGYRTAELSENNELSRVWIISGMAPDMMYHFRIRAVDENGAVVSADQTVKTSVAPPHPVEAELPREYVDTSMPLQTGAILEVDSECKNLENQLQRAVWGDTIMIPAGTTCTGRFTFPAKAADTQTPHRWIIIRTSTPDSVLPPDGVRIDPSWAPRLARLALNRPDAPNYVAAGAHHYRFIGIEFTAANPSAKHESGLLSFDPQSHHVIVDRCYLHGYDYPGSTRRGLSMDGSHVALINSYLTINNSQWYGFALVVDYGPGPGKIYNNFIQGPGITLFWTDNVPTPKRDDYEIRRNWIYADDKYKLGSPASDGRHYMHRQPLELKRGRRFLVDGNVWENWWADEQGGSEVMLFTPRGGEKFDGNEFEICDITITNNILRNVPGGINITAHNLGDAGGFRQTRVTKRFKIANNLMEKIDGFNACCDWKGGARGLILRINGGAEDVIFEHNTVYKQQGTGPRLFNPNDEAMEGLVYRNNIVWVDNAYNIGAFLYQGTFPAGPTPSSVKAILDAWSVRVPSPFYVFTNNVFPGATPGMTAQFQAQFPPGNFWPGDGDRGEEAIQFVDAANGNFYLRENSPYKRAGDDGRDIGADITAVEVAVGRVQHVRVEEVGSNKASISYYAPDAFACTVEVSPNADFSGAVRKADPGGQNRERVVAVDSLQPGTAYFYRILCASEQPQGAFTTASDDVAGLEGSRSVIPATAKTGGRNGPVAHP